MRPTTADSPPARGGRLGGEDDQQPQEVRVALQRPDGGRDTVRQVLRGTSEPPVRSREVGEEALGAALHDGEQDPVLRAVVVVDGAQRDARLLDDAGDVAASKPCSAITRSAASSTSSRDLRPRRFGVTSACVAMLRAYQHDWS